MLIRYSWSDGFGGEASEPEISSFLGIDYIESLECACITTGLGDTVSSLGLLIPVSLGKYRQLVNEVSLAIEGGAKIIYLEGVAYKYPRENINKIISKSKGIEEYFDSIKKKLKNVKKINRDIYDYNHYDFVENLEDFNYGGT